VIATVTGVVAAEEEDGDGSRSAGILPAVRAHPARFFL